MEIVEFIGKIEKEYRWLRKEKKKRGGRDSYFFIIYFFTDNIISKFNN